MAATVLIKWKLRSVMADRKMSATKLAELMGVNRVTVSGWANSDEVPTFRNFSETLDQLCRHLNCRVEELIEQSEGK
jgi:DNA-binding Xre family transcriptional regulator